MEPTRKRGRRPKSGFYHARWSKLMINQKKAAEILGVSVETIEEWDEHGNELAERYLLLWDQKRVRVEGWDGWIFTRGLLSYKNKKHFNAEFLLEADKAIAEKRALEFEIERIYTPLGIIKAVLVTVKRIRQRRRERRYRKMRLSF